MIIGSIPICTYIGMYKLAVALAMCRLSDLASRSLALAPVAGLTRWYETRVSLSLSLSVLG